MYARHVTVMPRKCWQIRYANKGKSVVMVPVATCVYSETIRLRLFIPVVSSYIFRVFAFACSVLKACTKKSSHKFLSFKGKFGKLGKLVDLKECAIPPEAHTTIDYTKVRPTCQGRNQNMFMEESSKKTQ